ncbi:hypothetical protein Lal_00023605 [Lupinus albus]|nr:hypothetical protein Lal_00023605 [Lupinus albus]
MDPIYTQGPADSIPSGYDAQRHLLKALQMEEEFWKDKCRLNCHIDPLSPLWFCLAGDVLSRGIANLVASS